MSQIQNLGFILSRLQRTSNFTCIFPSGRSHYRAVNSGTPAVVTQRKSEALDDGRVRLTATLAHGLQAVAAAGPLQLMQQLGGQHRAGRAERMAERDGAAVRVGLLQRRTGVRRPG